MRSAKHEASDKMTAFKGSFKCVPKLFADYKVFPKRVHSKSRLWHGFPLIGHCIPTIGIPRSNHIIILTVLFTVLFLLNAVPILIQILCGGRHAVEATMGLAKARALA